MSETLVDVIKVKLRQSIKDVFDLDVATITAEIPPRAELGDLAFPVCFELAKQIKAATGQKTNPRQLAEKLIPAAREYDSRIARVEIAGPGYLNFFYDRAAYLRLAVAQKDIRVDAENEKVIVEHTSINPNKAAHIGHLRNAVLGDTIVKLLRGLGKTVEVENYVDNTGVQVADVVVGFKYMESKTLGDIKQIKDKFDYYCWDLYAQVGHWYEGSPERKALRAQTLHELEESNNETAEMAEYISTTILRCHLDTMARIGIVYDVLPRESDILHLHFWQYAFERLKETNAIIFETEGRNKGCWVMKAEPSAQPTEKIEETEEQSQYDADKVIVKSNGIVTYVGKDIAFTLWKLGRLGMDFYYHPFYEYDVDGSKHTAWISSSNKDFDKTENRPSFGNGIYFYNVIDVGQSYTQQNVLEAVRRIAPDPRVELSAHLSYEKVSLSTAAARDLGVELSEEDQSKAQVGMSGRKGLGVKIDDLIDRLESNAFAEVQGRHTELSETEQKDIAHTLAVGALRYFLMKYTRTSVIAFDFKEALAFEGETGVYVQNAAVRIGSIFRKLAEANIPADGGVGSVSDARLAELMTGADGDDWWSLVYLASRLREVTEQAVTTLEPAFVAKFAFQLAQRFNVFYQKYRILAETDEARRALLITIAAYIRQQLIAALGLLGIEVPERM